MRQRDERSDVQLDHLAVALDVELREIAHRAEAGVIDERLDNECAPRRLIKQLLRRVALRQIERDELRVNFMFAFKFIRERRELVRRARHQQNVLTACRELPRELLAGRPTRG